MLPGKPELSNQAMFFQELNLLRAKLPADHPAQMIHAAMRTKMVKGFPGPTPKSIGYNSGVWSVFVPTRLLYLEIVNTYRAVSDDQRTYRDALIKAGFRFVVTDNFASAVLLVMEELGIKDDLVARNMRISELQINGTHRLLKMQADRINKRRKRERLKDKDESTKRRIGDPH